MMQSHSQGKNRDESSNGAGPLHDITTGENSDTAGLFGVDGFKASVGYDLTTGWGRPTWPSSYRTCLTSSAARATTRRTDGDRVASGSAV